MRKQWIILGSVAATATAGLALLLVLNDAIRHALLDPLISFYQALRLLIMSLPQLVIWGIVLLIGTALLSRAYPRPTSLRSRRSRPATPPVGQSDWTLIRLAGLIEHSRLRRSARAGIVRVLAETAVPMIARHEGVPLSRAQEMLLSQDWTDDGEVASFLALRSVAGAIPKEGFQRRLVRSVDFLERYCQEV
jgi:hypothetical protein